MIESFGSKETGKIWKGEQVRKLPIEIQNIGRRKLRMLNNSQNVDDVKMPPIKQTRKVEGNRFFKHQN
jgi:toxin HigB-1